MQRQRKKRDRETADQEGPIQPGTPIFRIIEFIAVEVAKALPSQPVANDRSINRNTNQRLRGSSLRDLRRE
jgi:hypothetical protein